MMTFPATAICMSCHQAIATDRPAIQKLAAYAKSGTPMPWVRVYDTPDYVFWSHGAHLAAKVDCVECHGRVADQDVMQQQTDVVTMLGLPAVPRRPPGVHRLRRLPRAAPMIVPAVS